MKFRVGEQRVSYVGSAPRADQPTSRVATQACSLAIHCQEKRLRITSESRAATQAANVVHINENGKHSTTTCLRRFATCNFNQGTVSGE